MCDSVCDGMRERVGLTLPRHRLGFGAMILQRHKEAEGASNQGAATKYEVAQPRSDRSALLVVHGHTQLSATGLDY
jgi:hypothetical protein